MTYFADKEYIEKPLPLTVAVGSLLLVGVAILDPVNIVPALQLVGVCIAQNTAFSIVSRARNRDNQLYHAVASVFSNGVYIVTFKLMFDLGFEWWILVPYIVGTVNGSLSGSWLSMKIERALGATADGHLSKSTK